MSGPINSGWMRYAFNAIPGVLCSVMAKSAGREAFYGVVMNLWERNQPGFDKSSKGNAFFAKTVRGAGFLIDFQWLGRIVSDFFSREYGFYRDSDNTIYKMEWDRAAGAYVRQPVHFTEWVKAEVLYITRLTRLDDKEQKAQFALYADVDLLPAKEINGLRAPAPKRAGLTTFQYLRRYEPINALAIVLFGCASFHSVASAVVPCFIAKDSDFTISGYLCSKASKFGSDQFFSPEKGKSVLDFAWEKGDSTLLTISYGLTAAHSAISYLSSPKNQAVYPLGDGLNFSANFFLSAFHGWKLLTGQDVRELVIVGRALQIALMVFEEFKKLRVEDVRKHFNLEVVMRTSDKTESRSKTEL